MTEPTDAELEALAVEHEAFGFGLADKQGLSTHGFDPDGLRCFARAVLAKWGEPPAVVEEPVMWAFEDGFGWWHHASNTKHSADMKPLYATPQPTQAQAGAVPQCWCLTCRPMRLEDPYSIRMALCPTCGNKRCPKANDHRNKCSGSNEPGQPGSAYSGGIKGGQHGAE